MAGPIEQFAIKPIVELGEIGGQPVAFTNSALFMVLTVLARLRSCFCRPAGHRCARALAVLSRDPLRIRVEDIARERRGKGYGFLPLVFSLFLFILFANLIGMFPMPSP